MRMEVHADGSVVVTAPWRSALRVIERFVVTHSAWARRKIEETRDRTVIRVARRDIAALKLRATQLLEERVAYFASLYGVSVRKITIRAQRARWGSCSEKGDLSFNYRLAALPERTADYVVVHELCHLLEFNHSKDFWALVEQAVPEHREIRRGLGPPGFCFL